MICKGREFPLKDAMVLLDSSGGLKMVGAQEALTELQCLEHGEVIVNVLHSVMCSF